MATQPIVNDTDWIDARKKLLAKEKAFMKLRDELTADRQSLPWRKVDIDYSFESDRGTSSLVDLFAGRSQLITVHFMYGPEWQEGCKSCSFWADQYDAVEPHLNARDVSLAVVSRSPWANIADFKQRMGWDFHWLSSANCQFNQDFNVSFPGESTGIYNYQEGNVMEDLPGLSVFKRDEDGSIYHTYSCYARGLDPLNATYQLLDLVPSGRNEEELSFPMAWVNHHDKY